MNIALVLLRLLDEKIRHITKLLLTNIVMNITAASICNRIQ